MICCQQYYWQTILVLGLQALCACETTLGQVDEHCIHLLLPKIRGMKPEVIIEVRVHDDKPDFSCIKWLVFLCGFVLPAMQDSYSRSGGKPIESLTVVSTKTQYSTKILEMWSDYQYCLVRDLPGQINCNQFHINRKNTSVLILHCLRKNAAPLYR